jgi:hypothetical protein
LEAGYRRGDIGQSSLSFRRPIRCPGMRNASQHTVSSASFSIAEMPPANVSLWSDLGGRPGSSKKGYADLEQFLHIGYPPFVLKEQDHVVLGLDDGVMVRDDDLLAPHDGGDVGPLG